MNCDQAFDAITDPTGAESAALQAHLAQCPRCREMRETLAPALYALSEDRDAAVRSGSAWPAASLPRLDLQQLAATAAGQLTATSSAQPTAAPRRRTLSGVSSHLLTAALLLAIGAGIGWGGHRLAQPPAPLRPTGLATPSGMPSACLWKSRQTGANATDESPRSVVLSCLACHLANR